MMTDDLFDDLPARLARQALAPGAVLLAGFASAMENDLWQAVQALWRQAPPRQLVTPGGYTMSVAMSNCGPLGWVSDLQGYRYQSSDPLSGQPWPAMPALFLDLAAHAAEAAGYPGFAPDACLINLYRPGARLSLHQDRDEIDRSAPIVSVSLGLPAVFLFGGLHRTDRPQRLPLLSGDVVVWGGPSRLAFHGIAPLAKGHHRLAGERRINLTFRKAG